MYIICIHVYVIYTNGIIKNKYFNRCTTLMISNKKANTCIIMHVTYTHTHTHTYTHVNTHMLCLLHACSYPYTIFHISIFTIFTYISGFRFDTV